MIQTDSVPALPEPAGYFRAGERTSFLLGSRFEIRWNGSFQCRGDHRNGIALEHRQETDWKDQDGRIVLQAPLDTFDYTEQTKRVRTIEKLPVEASRNLLPFFRVYLEGWNRLVALDRSGASVKAIHGDRLTRDYVTRRKNSQHPLRTKSWSRVCSIPVTAEIKAVLKQHLKLDWRTTSGLRLIRYGQRVALAYVHKEIQIREVDLEQNSLNSCRDPRLCDMGICLSPYGMTLMLQNPTDDHQGFHIPIANLTKAFIDKLVADMNGRIRSVMLDPICPNNLRTIKTHLVRRLRTLQAEGAIEFRSPKLVSLGAVYKDLPQHDPLHLKVWQRKLMEEFFDYTRILGLTGAPLMVRESDGVLRGVNDRQIDPLTRANHVLQSGLAKMDLWHGATFLRSRPSHRVRSAFNRYRCRIHQLEAHKRQ